MTDSESAGKTATASVWGKHIVDWRENLHRTSFPFSRALLSVLCIFPWNDDLSIQCAFFVTWFIIFYSLEGILNLIEWPLYKGLLPSDKPRRSASIVVVTIVTLVTSLFLATYIPVLRAFFWLFVLHRTLSSLAIVARFPIAGKGSRAMGPLLAVIHVAIAVTVIIWNPEGQYNERYIDNRLTAAEKAAPAPFPGRAPESLSDKELAQALIQTYLRVHDPAKLNWSWEETVALEGIWSHQSLRDQKTEAFFRAWIENHRAEAMTETLWADATAPACVVLALGPEPEDKAWLDRVDAYVFKDSNKLRDGSISHVGDKPFVSIIPMAWVDSLFMHGVYLNRRARNGEKKALDLSRSIYKAMESSLLDKESGLFRHANIQVGGFQFQLPVERCFWARGNAWVAWYLTDYIETLRFLKAPRDTELEATFQLMMDAVLKSQDSDSGLWPTDLSLNLHEQTPGADLSNDIESCGSALLTASLARGQRLGLLKGRPVKEALKRSYGALRNKIRWDNGHPSFLGSSRGTHPGFRAYYRSILRDENIGHGVGAYLLALSEKQKLEGR